MILLLKEELNLVLTYQTKLYFQLKPVLLIQDSSKCQQVALIINELNFYRNSDWNPLFSLAALQQTGT